MGVLNPRHEAFARGLVAGKTADQAYVDAGYKRDRRNAARLTTNDDIASRVGELQAENRERLHVTVTSITRQLQEDRDLAYKQGQAAAAVQATVNLAKLHGFMVDRRQVQVVDNLTEEELDRDIADLLEQLGDDEPSNATKH